MIMQKTETYRANVSVIQIFDLNEEEQAEYELCKDNAERDAFLSQCRLKNESGPMVDYTDAEAAGMEFKVLSRPITT